MKLEHRGWHLDSVARSRLEGGWWAQYQPSDYLEKPRLVIGKGPSPDEALAHAIEQIDVREDEK